MSSRPSGSEERRRLLPYLDLIRIHLTPTAVADSFAGFCLAASVRGGDSDPLVLAAAAGCSVLLYWMGMVTNDVFDAPRDRWFHPERPIPSGRVSVRAAGHLATGLGLSAIGLAFTISPGTAWLAATLAFLAIIYNAGGKWIPVFGNVLMGSCRSANLLLGAMAALGAAPASTLFLASIYDFPRIASVALGIYIACITAVSLLEDRPHHPWQFLAFTAPPCLLLPAALASQGGYGVLSVLNAAALAVLLGISMVRGFRRPFPALKEEVPPAAKEGSNGTHRKPFPSDTPASPDAEAQPPVSLADPQSTHPLPIPDPHPLREPRPHPAESFVGAGLQGIFLIDAGFLIAGGLPRQAAVEYGLLILAWLCRSRWLQSSA